MSDFVVDDDSQSQNVLVSSTVASCAEQIFSLVKMIESLLALQVE